MEMKVKTYLVKIVVIFLESIQSIMSLVAHAGQALEDGVVMLRFGRQSAVQSMLTRMYITRWLVRSSGLGSSCAGGVKPGEDGIPVVGFRGLLLVSSSSRLSWASGAGRDKVKALVAKSGGFGLGLASRWAAVENRVEVIQSRARDVGKILIGRTFLGVL